MGILGMHQASRGEIIGTLARERGVREMARRESRLETHILFFVVAVAVVVIIGFGLAAYYFWTLYGPLVLHIGGE